MWFTKDFESLKSEFKKLEEDVLKKKIGTYLVLSYWPHRQLFPQTAANLLLSEVHANFIWTSYYEETAHSSKQNHNYDLIFLGQPDRETRVRLFSGGSIEPKNVRSLNEGFEIVYGLRNQKAFDHL